MENMNQLIDDEKIYINVEYSFPSNLGNNDAGRYIKEVQGKIYSGESPNNQENELIGYVDFTLLLIESAKGGRFNMRQLFSYDGSLFRYGTAIYDFENDSFKTNVKNHCDVIFANVCFIERLILKTAYRGHRLGPKIFKDLVGNFESFAGIFIIEPSPMQFDIVDDNDTVVKDFGLDQFETNRIKAIKHLTAEYESWGFEKIKGIPDLLFFNTKILNEKFEAINIEEL